MCSNDYYEPAPPDCTGRQANVFEGPGRQRFLSYPRWRQDAGAEQMYTKLSLTTLGDVIMQPGHQGMYDEVYTADASLTMRVPSRLNGARIVTILANFCNQKRQPEVELHRKFLESLNDGREIYQCPYPFEAGDFVYDPFRKLLWAGYSDEPCAANVQSGRTDIRSHAFIIEKTGVEVVSLKTKKPYYHNDTVMAALTEGHIVGHPRNLHPDSHKTFMRNAFDRFSIHPDNYLLDLSDEDIAAFAPNLQNEGDRIVMPKCSERLLDALADENYKVRTVKVDTYKDGGGAVHCVSNRISGYECDRVIG
jgi:N-dimethylarginine dimethylaminohydrolase